MRYEKFEFLYIFHARLIILPITPKISGKIKGKGNKDERQYIWNLINGFEKYDEIDYKTTDIKDQFEKLMEYYRSSVEQNEICTVYSDKNEFLGFGQRQGDELKVLRILSVRE